MSRGVCCIVTNTQEGMFIILSSQHPLQRGPLVLTEAANTAVSRRSSPLDARKDGCIDPFVLCLTIEKTWY